MSMDQAISKAKQAVAAGQLTPAALHNLTSWLSEDRYRAYQPAIVEHIEAGKWQKLDDVFWTVIPFGTGGRRGRMYAFGSNAINERTIGESAQGLATYILEQPRPKDHQLKCAIAYDTRHRSREFAELVRIDHGGQRLRGLFPGRLPGHAATVIRGASLRM